MSRSGHWQFKLRRTAFARKLADVVAAIVIARLILGADPAGITALAQTSWPPRGGFHADSGNALAVPSSSSSASPVVTLLSGSGETVEFAADNGYPTDGVTPEKISLPRLVLYRNGRLTDPDERTVTISVGNLTVPPPGVRVAIHLETLHPDPDRLDTPAAIPVWTDSRWITNPSTAVLTDAVARFTITFDELVSTEVGSVATPTDYYNLRVSISDSLLPDATYVRAVEPAFLLEQEWMAELPGLREETPGAAPDDLVVYFCDMFPFQRSASDPTTRLARADVPEFVASALVPEMVEAVRKQSVEWGFVWHDEWTSYRPGVDEERLSVALSDGKTWYRDVAPYGAHAGISINVNEGESAAYGSLLDGTMGIFHHELFHNLQRSLRRHLAGGGDVDGLEDAWAFFSEGTAVLATTVAQPDVQFASENLRRMYIFRANAFLRGDGASSDDLNTSYRTMNPYGAALYWRFLYERCGGLAGDTPDPAVALEIIRQSWAALYDGSIVNIDSSTDLVRYLPRIMDQALASTPSCPFQTFEESRAALAQALYALRLDGGRCSEADQPTGCQLYDPNRVYAAPAASSLSYTGALVNLYPDVEPYPPGIASSFGVDFVVIDDEAPPNSPPMQLEFAGAPETAAVFYVQVLRLEGGPEAARLGPALASGVVDGSSSLVTTLERNGEERARFALLITRQDADETIDAYGEYRIAVRPKRSQR